MHVQILMIPLEHTKQNEMTWVYCGNKSISAHNYALKVTPIGLPVVQQSSLLWQCGGFT